MREFVTALGEFGAEDGVEHVVGKLGLLQADHVG